MLRVVRRHLARKHIQTYLAAAQEKEKRMLQTRLAVSGQAVLASMLLHGAASLHDPLTACGLILFIGGFHCGLLRACMRLSLSLLIRTDFGFLSTALGVSLRFGRLAKCRFRFARLMASARDKATAESDVSSEHTSSDDSSTSTMSA